MTGTPFMITQAQKEALHARGYSDEQIAALKPEEVHKLLNGGDNGKRNRLISQ